MRGPAPRRRSGAPRSCSPPAAQRWRKGAGPQPTVRPARGFPRPARAQPWRVARTTPRCNTRPRRRMQAFTLIEVMVVVVILAVLAALIVPRVMSRPDEARVVAARQDIAALRQALKLYRLDNLRYPSTEQGLGALVERPALPPVPPNWKSGGYLERLPRDPWCHPSQYLSPALRGELDVFSCGADGAAGGEGFDGDIGSWNL